MRIVVFAAAGKVGQEVVKAALAAGHEVVGIVRKGQTLPITDERVKAIEAELDEGAALETALQGADAAITAFGPGRSTRDSVLSDGLKNVLDAMQKVGVSRIVLLSTNSISETGDKLDLPWELIKLFIRTGAPGAVAEIARMAKHARASSLDYTLVRVPFLAEGEKKGKTREGMLGHGAIGYNITRADLAEYMVRQVTNREHVRQAISVSN